MNDKQSIKKSCELLRLCLRFQIKLLVERLRCGIFSCLLTIQKQTDRNSGSWKGLAAASSQIFAEVELSPIENDTEEKQNSKKKCKPVEIPGSFKLLETLLLTPSCNA